MNRILKMNKKICNLCNANLDDIDLSFTRHNMTFSKPVYKNKHPQMQKTTVINLRKGSKPINSKITSLF